MEAISRKCVNVPALDNMEPELFGRKYYNKSPVVLKKCAESWKPCNLWTPDYLKGALEEAFQDLEVLESLDNKHFIDNSNFTTRRKMSPRTFIDYVFHERDFSPCVDCENGRSHLSCSCDDRKKLIYLRTNSMPITLHKDISMHPQIGTLQNKVYSTRGLQVGSVDEFSRIVFRQATMQLWIGTKGNVTPLHYDRNHGLLLQVTGDKRVILFSHEDTSSLYPYPSHYPNSHVSRVKFRDVKNEAELEDRFPKFYRAQPYSCVISRGDILYTPPFWWHDVTSLDNCVSVTLPWDLNSADEIPSCMLR